MSAEDGSDLPMLLALSRRALLMYRLTEREQQIAEVILQWSFARGRAEALIPELDYFAKLTGIDVSDVRKSLNRMIDRAIVQVKELGRDSGGRKRRAYRFRPFAAWWQDAPCRVDVDAALAAAEELDRINDLGRDAELSGQVFDETIEGIADDDLDDGLSAASRDQAMKAAALDHESGDAHTQDAARRERDAQTQKVPAGPRPPREAGTREGDPPIPPAMGKPPNSPPLGDSPNGSQTCARAPAVQHVQNSRTLHVQNVAGAAKMRRFADAEKQLAIEQIERLCAGSKGFRKYWWVSNVRDLPATLVLEAVGDTTTYLRANKCREEPGAVLWRRVIELAADRGIAIKKPPRK